MTIIDKTGQHEVDHAHQQAAPQVDSSDSMGSRPVFITPRAIAAAWFVAIVVATQINPAAADAVQPTTTLTVLTNLAAVAWMGTLVAGVVRFRGTPTLGLVTGAFMLVGHLICGIDGHLPMTGAIWITQLMLVAAATAISGLALATRR